MTPLYASYSLLTFIPAVARATGNRTHAAEALGLSRQGLLNKIARYQLEEGRP